MSLERYKTNPFLADMIVPVKERRVKLSRMGQDNNVLVNQNTGEIHGTHLTTFKAVDGEQFVKLFTQNIALTFDLGACGVKGFNVLMFAVQNSALSKDEVHLDHLVLEDFLKANADREPPLKLSIATFKRGLNELEKAKIIAKTLRKGRYWINPNFAFNGDRIAFTTVIQKRGKTYQEEAENHGQQRLLD